MSFLQSFSFEIDLVPTRMDNARLRRGGRRVKQKPICRKYASWRETRARVWGPSLALRVNNAVDGLAAAGIFWRLRLFLQFSHRLCREEGCERIRRPRRDGGRLNAVRRVRNRRRRGIAQHVFLDRRERLFLGEGPLGLLLAQVKDDATDDEESRHKTAQVVPVGDAVAERFVIKRKKRRQIIQQEPYADDDEGRDLDDADPPAEPNLDLVERMNGNVRPHDAGDRPTRPKARNDGMRLAGDVSEARADAASGVKRQE